MDQNCKQPLVVFQKQDTCIPYKALLTGDLQGPTLALVSYLTSFFSVSVVHCTKLTFKELFLTFNDTIFASLTLI